jgi:hypothetical protein
MLIFMPDGYLSGDPLSSTATWNGTNFGNLVVNPARTYGRADRSGPERSSSEGGWGARWRHNSVSARLRFAWLGCRAAQTELLEPIAETQPQLQPALLRLSAITSQFFIRFRQSHSVLMLVGLNCGFEFEKGRQLLVCTHDKTSSVAAAATSQIGRPLQSIVAIQPQFHPALRKGF